MIVFGGFDPFGNRLSDTWVLTNANGMGGTPQWSQLVVNGSSPSARYGHSAVYDPKTNEMIIFGGDDATGFLNDSWILFNANGLGGTPSWLNELTTGLPAKRTFHSAIYSSSLNRMLIFGGYIQPNDNCCGENFSQEVWLLNNANTP